MSGPTADAPARRGADGEHDDERWLLTYADMITLLMALFMVLFSISSVNISKFETLQRVAAGRVLRARPAGRAGRSRRPAAPPTQVEPADRRRSRRRSPSLGGQPVEAGQQPARPSARAGRVPASSRSRSTRYARAHGFSGQDPDARSTAAGLSSGVLTDTLLFDSGQADAQAGRLPLLGQDRPAARGTEQRHPIHVEGHTDNVPIRGAQYPSNWELSTARASTRRALPDRRRRRHRRAPLGCRLRRPASDRVQRHAPPAAPATAASRSCCPAHRTQSARPRSSTRPSARP